jgi:hypothetical protein
MNQLPIILVPEGLAPSLDGALGTYCDLMDRLEKTPITSQPAFDRACTILSQVDETLAPARAAYRRRAEDAPLRRHFATLRLLEADRKSAEDAFNAAQHESITAAAREALRQTFLIRVSLHMDWSDRVSRIEADLLRTVARANAPEIAQATSDIRRACSCLREAIRVPVHAPIAV